MKDIETKKLMGRRESDSDGFTYSYGKFKFSRRGAKNRARVAQLVRHDKRAAKMAAFRREMVEQA